MERRFVGKKMGGDGIGEGMGTEMGDGMGTEMGDGMGTEDMFGAQKTLIDGLSDFNFCRPQRSWRWMSDPVPS